MKFTTASSAIALLLALTVASAFAAPKDPIIVKITSDEVSVNGSEFPVSHVANALELATDGDRTTQIVIIADAQTDPRVKSAVTDCTTHGFSKVAIAKKTD